MIKVFFSPKGACFKRPKNASKISFSKASRGSWASEAPGNRPAASQPPACPVSSAGPPRCRCPAAPAPPASAGSCGPPCCGRANSAGRVTRLPAGSQKPLQGWQDGRHLRAAQRLPRLMEGQYERPANHLYSVIAALCEEIARTATGAAEHSGLGFLWAVPLSTKNGEEAPPAFAFKKRCH